MCFAHSPRASGAAGNFPFRELRILPEAFCAMEIQGISYCIKKSDTNGRLIEHINFRHFMSLSYF